MRDRVGARDMAAQQKGALVLLVEDEPEVADIVQAYLERDGMRAVRAYDGRSAIDTHRRARPDIVLLDVLLPALDGWQVLSSIRNSGDTPVIMLTAHDLDIDKLTALRMGADDYVVKPFNPAEVVARIRAVLRRTQSLKSDSLKALRVGPLLVDQGCFQASVEAEGHVTVLPLTLTEFRLLAHMARMPGRAFTRLDLLENCLPEGDALERTVDSHLSKLRKKLEQAGAAAMLTSIRGVGYLLGDAR
ncbi:MAG: response regulator transcription factor [Rubrivivax sp.]|nr:MAG: response regulator transcription factor [Rubrivivax sp.]